MWESAYGVIAPGLRVSHACRNGRCVNIDHLAVCRPACATIHDKHLPKVERSVMAARERGKIQMREWRSRQTA